MIENIRRKIEKELSPDFLEIKDNSHLHIGHLESGEGKNTHFSITVKSSKLKDLNMIQAHRKINSLLIDEFNKGLHALEIKIIK